MKRAPSGNRGVNHARLNHQQIKEQEALNRQRQQQDACDAERKANLIRRQKGQYAHVASALSKENVEHGYATRGQAGPVDDVEIKVFVRECEPDRQIFSMMESAALQQRQGRDATSTAAAGRAPASGAPQPSQHQTRLPALSAQARGPSAGGAPPSREARGPMSTATPPSSGHRGEVPQYLLKRKAQLNAEKQLVQEELERRAELAKYPPGHRPVSEEERADILSKLAERKKELEMELGRLPMRYDTQAIKNRKNQIEAEMVEVEAAERKFSVKKQLFVPI